MARPSVAASELPSEVLKQLGIKEPRRHKFTKESVRCWALKSLALMSGLTQDQRRRVFEHAMRVNRF